MSPHVTQLFFTLHFFATLNKTRDSQVTSALSHAFTCTLDALASRVVNRSCVDRSGAHLEPLGVLMELRRGGKRMKSLTEEVERLRALLRELYHAVLIISIELGIEVPEINPGIEELDRWEE